MAIHPVTADRLADLANLFDSNGTTRDARATMTHTAAMDKLLTPPEGNSADDEYYVVTWEVERPSSYPIRSVTEALHSSQAGYAQRSPNFDGILCHTPQRQLKHRALGSCASHRLEDGDQME